jgi:hypothetical protein
VLGGWARRFLEAIGDRESVGDIAYAINEVAASLEPPKLATVVAETSLVASAVGALEADWETREDRDLEPAEFGAQAELPLLLREKEPRVIPDFIKSGQFRPKAFEAAIDDFLDRKVVTRDVYDSMVHDARVRAFTVAGLAERDMVESVRDELAKTMREGASLRGFRKRLRERFEGDGWLKAKPSAPHAPTRTGTPWHVETIFRNGVMGSYGRARVQQMSQPHVVAARPYWQVQTVRDARQRKTHGQAHGKVIPADSPVWQRAGAPPWGHACRCRLVSRSAKWVEDTGASISHDLPGLPDPGWSPNAVVAPTLPAPPPEAVPVNAPEYHGADPPTPKHTRFDAEAHVGTVEVPSRGKSRKAYEAAMAGYAEPDVLDALERMKLPALTFRPGRGRQPPNGTYQPLTGRIEMNSTRPEWTWGEPAKLGDGAWSSDSVATNKAEAMRRTFTHEVGHHIHQRGTMQQPEIWQEVNAAWAHARVTFRRRTRQANTPPPLTKYSMKNRREYFAETFAAYVHERETLRRLDPRGFEMVETVLDIFRKRPQN